MKAIKQMFQEDGGKYSSIRLFSFIALIMAGALSWKGSGFDIITIWLVAAFAPKAVQRFAEKK
jgi:hypothetical protein